MRFVSFVFAVLILTIITGCSSVILQPVDYTWQLETVLDVKPDGSASETRYAININVKQLFFEEFEKYEVEDGTQIRMIRDHLGYFYVTAKGFKNIYVLSASEGAMKVNEKINIYETETITDPVFNQRTPNIEFLDGEKKFVLDNKGIVR